MASEQRDIAAVALALPPGWCVQLEPPHGQMAIGPLAGRVRYTRCWVGRNDRRVIQAEPWRPPRTARSV